MNKPHYTWLMVAILSLNIVAFEAVAGKPTIVCAPDIVVSNDLGQCSAVVTFTVIGGGNPTPTVTCVPPSGSAFFVGTNVVSCTASNNSATTNCSFRIKVVDIIPPQIFCPADILVECAGSNGTIVPFTAQATDLCDTNVMPICRPPSGSAFARGITTVTCVATDSSGNSNQCAFKVAVRDTTPPLITCTTNIIAAEFPHDSGFATVTFAAPIVTDICDSSVAFDCSPPSGSTFPVGITPVTCRATDASGNTNGCAFTVRVIPYRLHVVTSTANSGNGSLRQALFDANDAPGENLIIFNIPGDGPFVIEVLAALPVITSPVIIDGYSETSISNAPVVEIKGSNGEFDGLVITAGNSVVQGLILNQFATAIRLEARGGNIVRGNYIGTDATGSVILGNSGDGLSINSPTNIIGGPNPVAGNLISGNAGDGIHLSGSGAIGNLIRGNSIAFNGNNGVSLAADCGNGNAIRRNSITANGALGIDLGADGVTANDADDADTGANQLQNFPLLTDVRSIDGITMVDGTLNDLPNGTYQLEFFLNDFADPSGFGEGALYLGSLTVSVQGDGPHEFSFSVPYTAIYTQYVAATATDAGNNTSEFSRAVKVRTPPVLDLQPVGTNTVIGTQATFCSAASGTPPIYYQWRLNGINISGATNQCYAIPAAQLASGGSYAVFVYNVLGAIGTIPVTLDLSLANAVTNVADNFADSVLLQGTNGFAMGANRLATAEPGEPLHAGKPGGKSVWYKWTAPVTGILTLGTPGSTFDTLLAVYTGTSVSNLTTVASDEDRGGFFTSGLRFNVIKGNEYKFAVDGFGGAEGLFILNWIEEDTPHLLPQIVAQPAGQTVAPGSNVTFVVIAQRACGNGHGDCPDPTNFPPDGEVPQLEYHWFFNHVLIDPLQTNNILLIPNAQGKDVGSYSVQVTYADRTVESLAADLQMNAVGNLVQNVQAFNKFLDAANSAPLQFGTFIVPPTAGQGTNQASAAIGFVSGYSGFQTFNNFNADTDPVGDQPTSCGTLTAHSMWTKFTVGETGMMQLTSLFSNLNANTFVVGFYRPLGQDVPWAITNCAINSLTLPVNQNLEYIIGCDGVNGATGVMNLLCSLVVPTKLVPGPKTTQGYSLSITGFPGMKFQIQATTNLTKPNWQTLVTTNSFANTFNFTDTRSTNAQRFYRAKMQF